ncbi:hypothetical protein J2Z21_008883 [Streptomyces griseochromogenes]|uniref:Uncharacterized protein n=1 Tax=Streptomyces griseochromogenes TaxID=68214 RepID=A0A1B1AZN1_9ACTN|nr:DUF6083 domain-containing protein [Streptomyces griseochromogenes]ANP52015.1 hypothetical protein AVL59_22725 [Streptomyces griseochromogenes]MBP2055867.1 hypothetical protein [Streptomyces griseochromogenes]
MRPRPAHTGRHWDDSPRRIPPRRSLQIASNSPSRLLRAGQTSRCRHCGTRIDWYPRHDDRPIALHPTEVATADVSQACRWHLSGGIAHPHDDGSGWCRIPHAALCPQQTPHPRTSSPRLTPLRRELALRSRRLIDTGAFTPQSHTPATATPEDDDKQPARPVARILLVDYLGEGPIEEIHCVAQTRQRRRCTHPILDPARPTGHWTLLPTQPRHGQLTLPDTHMAVYDLSHLPYADQLRWRTQRCTNHAATPTAADLALAGWQPFDPLLHTVHIHTQLPPPQPHHLRRR